MTVHPFPNAPTHRTVRLVRLDGTEFALAGFTGGSDTWEWISETVARECDCLPEQVHVFELYDGDLLTVDGLPVFKLQ